MATLATSQMCKWCYIQLLSGTCRGFLQRYRTQSGFYISGLSYCNKWRSLSMSSHLPLCLSLGLTDGSHIVKMWIKRAKKAGIADAIDVAQEFEHGTGGLLMLTVLLSRILHRLLLSAFIFLSQYWISLNNPHLTWSVMTWQTETSWQSL